MNKHEIWIEHLHREFFVSPRPNDWEHVVLGLPISVFVCLCVCLQILTLLQTIDLYKDGFHSWYEFSFHQTLSQDISADLFVAVDDTSGDLIFHSHALYP